MMLCSQIHAGQLHVHMCALAVHEKVTTGWPTTAGRELSEAQRAGSEPGRLAWGGSGYNVWVPIRYSCRTPCQTLYRWPPTLGLIR